MKVKALVARYPAEPFSVEELDLADPQDDEILVKIAGVGPVSYTHLTLPTKA